MGNMSENQLLNWHFDIHDETTVNSSHFKIQRQYNNVKTKNSS